MIQETHHKVIIFRLGDVFIIFIILSLRTLVRSLFNTEQQRLFNLLSQK